jgi:hypothetical protein
MIYRASRVDEIKNNLIEIIIMVIPLPLLAISLIKSEESTVRILLEICFAFYLIHVVYWIILNTESTTYEISEKGIRWRSKLRRGFASWDRVYIKFKGNKAHNFR